MAGSRGGGRIIEEDQTISVNNPRVIRAWQRAAHWVGSISPPAVVGYRQWDSLNVWIAGNAAFMRHWTSAYVDSQAAGSQVRNKFDVASCRVASQAAWVLSEDGAWQFRGSRLILVKPWSWSGISREKTCR